MVIASIDIQDGKVVLELAAEFNRYGEVAVIDLDAAKGKGSNIEIIKPLLRRAECRVGGGIRTPEQAKELVSFGARKIIVGSGAFRTENQFAVNVPFLEAMSKKSGWLENPHRP
jgi:phosphoribosyl-ATP pyrophosphohydrolase/phosphoribosyl-AMP cyclohydrolase